MPGLYGSDLAAAHASGFSGLSLAGGAVVLEALAQAGLHTGTIVDLGCGAGEWAALAAARGFDVVGVDVSAAMLDIARARATGARFISSSLWDVELPPRLVAVTAFGESLNYGAPALPSVADLSRLCARVAANLVEGGVFACDLMVAGEPMSYRSWRDEDGRTLLVDVSEDTDAAELVRSIVVFTRDAGAYRRSDERHVIRVYDRVDVERALSDACLAWTVSSAYGEFQLGPRRVAYIARLSR